MDLKRTIFGYQPIVLVILLLSSSVIAVSAATAKTTSTTTTTTTMSSNLNHHGLIPILKTKLPPDREPFLLGDLALIEIKRNIIIRDDDVTTLMIGNIGSPITSSYSSASLSAMLTSISS